MITARNVLLFPLILAITGTAQAQLVTSLRLSKNQYVAGEPVIASVTITNHSGQDLTFTGDSRIPWLDFIVKDARGNPVNPKPKAEFGKMTIGMGQSMAREVDLTRQFNLTDPGNFSAVAIVRTPGASTEGFSTNRALFNLNPGRLFGTPIKVGLPGRPGQSREFRILSFAGDQKTQIYAQVLDGRSGQSIRTFLLGDALMLRKPFITVDRSQRMHVMFLATPTMWVHCEIDTDGRLVNRQIHQRGPQGDPQFVTSQDGSVQVSNSIPYDPAAAAAARSKIRKASERPAISFQ